MEASRHIDVEDVCKYPGKRVSVRQAFPPDCDRNDGGGAVRKECQPGIEN